MTKLATALVGMFLFAASFALARTVVVNEIVASNGATLQDQDGDFPDWIELHNPGPETIALAGWGLSDDDDTPRRWLFTEGQIPAGGFVVVFASGKDRPDADPPHANFSISASGEPILLTAPDESLVDRVGPRPIPRDVSWGRKPDGADDWFYFDAPTPGAPNTTDAYIDILDPPVFSHPGGFYTEPFDLTLGTGDPETTIYYTLDGSIPDPNNLEGTTFEYKNIYPRYPGGTFGTFLSETFRTRIYTTPIEIADRSNDPDHLSRKSTHASVSWPVPPSPVFKGRVVRARSFRSDAVPSSVATCSYFVTPRGVDRYSLPVLALTVQEDHFYDYEDGISVAGRDFDEWREESPTVAYCSSRPHNFNRRGRELGERPGYIELFDSESEDFLFMDLGVRIHGGASRANWRKSFRLYARSEYGNESINHPVFPSLTYDQYKRLLIRNSGNDYWITNFRDVFIQSLMSHLDVDVQEHRSVILFINAEYWGVYHLRERLDKYYYKRVYGVDEENLDIFGNKSGILEGDRDGYQNIRIYIAENDMRQPEHYEHVKSHIVVESFIDFWIAQIFSGNITDLHDMMWRLRTQKFVSNAPDGHDGRFRWSLYDLDQGFGSMNDYSHHENDMIRWALQEANVGIPCVFLLRELMRNDSFRAHFINRFADQLNTAFLQERVVSLVKEYKELYEPEMFEHIHRWPYPRSIHAWRESVDVMSHYAEHRPEKQRLHIMSNFGISHDYQITINTSNSLGGYVRVNTVEILPETLGVGNDPYPWTGRYFFDIPIEVQAVPRPGFRFVAWNGNVHSTTDTLRLTPEDDIALTAVFEYFPAPHPLRDAPWTLDAWPADAPPATYPPNMVFLQTDTKGPALDEPVEDLWTLPYDLESRSRLVGLDDDGFAFLNTANPQEEGGGYLGAALLALDTRECASVEVAWRAATVRPNDREYAIRLLWRVGTEGPFDDVLDPYGDPVEYVRHPDEGHARVLGPARLPESALGHPCVQLMWKYYATGGGEESGPRAMLAVAAIRVTAPDPAMGWLFH